MAPHYCPVVLVALVAAALALLRRLGSCGSRSVTTLERCATCLRYVSRLRPVSTILQPGGGGGALWKLY